MPLLLSLAWRNSASRRDRSILTILAVALGVAMILGTLLTAAALRLQLNAAGAALVGKADAEIFAFSDAGLSPEMVTAISKLPEVSASAPVVSKRVNGLVFNRPQAFELVGIDPTAEQRLHPLALAAGSLLGPDDTAGVMLDQAWARDHGVQVGTRIVLFTALGPDVFKVAGLLKNSAFSQSAFGSVAFVSLTAAQKSFRLGARVTEVSVALSGSYSAFRTDLRNVAVDEYSVRDNHAFYGNQRDPFADIAPVLTFFSILATAIGLFLIYNNLAVTVLERRREIGLLRAAGATTGWVRRLFLVQAAILGVAGSLLGVLLGVLLAYGLAAYLSGVGAGSDLSIAVDGPQLAAVLALGILATLVFAIIPSARAAAVSPLEAIRPQGNFGRERAGRRRALLGAVVTAIGLLLLADTASAGPPSADLATAALVTGAVTVVLLFAGILLLLPVLVAPLTSVIVLPMRLLSPGLALLARNALVRRPNRTALTIAGLFVSTAMVVSVAGLTQGALGSGEAWANSLFVSDRLVVSPVHQEDQIRDQLQALSGVAATSPIAFFSLRSGDRAINLAAIDPLDYAANGALELIGSSRQAAYAELEDRRGLFISRRLADSRGIKLGDAVVLTASGGGDFTYHVVGITQHTLPSPSGDETALISRGNARQDFNVQGFNILQVVATRPVPAGFDAALRNRAEAYGMQLESVADVRAGIRRGLDTLLSLLTGVGLVAVLVGLISLVTTILLNISESAREFALLRAVGMTREQVRRVVLTQSALLGLTGGVVGAAVGLLLLAVMVSASSSSGFAPAFQVPWVSIAVIVAATVVGALVAVVVPARRAARASVVASIRYE